MMNIEDTKHLSIKDYLKEQGICPTKEHSGYGMYKSPFRDEKTASIKVDYQKNLWHDFGSGEGGSIIDLVMKMHKCNFIQAIEFIKIQYFLEKRFEDHDELSTPKPVYPISIRINWNRSTKPSNTS